MACAACTCHTCPSNMLVPGSKRVEGMLNSNDSSKQRVARQARRGRVVSAMQRCAVQLFNAVVGDSRVSVFFKNSDPACKDCSRVWHGHVLRGYELSRRF